MPYATQQDLVDLYGERRLIELTDRADPPADEIDAAVLAQAQADADAEIDSYVGVKYTVPVAPAPPVLRAYAVAITYYKLHIEAAPDQVRDAYRQALAWLKAIAAGTAVLPPVDGATPAGAGDMVRVSGPDRVFSRDTLGGF